MARVRPGMSQSDPLRTQADSSADQATAFPVAVVASAYRGAESTFKTGAGIALALVPLSIAGILPSLSSLAVFALAVVFAITDTDHSD